MLAIMIIDLNFIMRIIPVIVIPVVPVTFCPVAIGIRLLVGRAAAAKPPALRLQPVRRVIHMLGCQHRRPRAVLLPAVDQAAKAVVLVRILLRCRVVFVRGILPRKASVRGIAVVVRCAIIICLCCLPVKQVRPIIDRVTIGRNVKSKLGVKRVVCADPRRANASSVSRRMKEFAYRISL